MPDHSLTRDEVRDVDRRAVEEFAMPSIVLMENAGRGTVDVLEQLGIGGPVTICAGKGNNGGDGFVVARHLDIRGHTVRVLLCCDPGELQGDALTNYRIVRAAGLSIEVLAGDPEPGPIDGLLAGAEWIVDALLGTGARGEVRKPYATVIERINASGAKVLSVDLPSGLDCDTGQPMGCCVRADHTCTFVARKAGFDASGAEQYTGMVHVVGIGVPRRLMRE